MHSFPLLHPRWPCLCLSSIKIVDFLQEKLSTQSILYTDVKFIYPRSPILPAKNVLVALLIYLMEPTFLVWPSKDLTWAQHTTQATSPLWITLVVTPIGLSFPEHGPCIHGFLWKDSWDFSKKSWHTVLCLPLKLYTFLIFRLDDTLHFKG